MIYFDGKEKERHSHVGQGFSEDLDKEKEEKLRGSPGQWRACFVTLDLKEFIIKKWKCYVCTV